MQLQLQQLMPLFGKRRLKMAKQIKNKTPKRVASIIPTRPTTKIPKGKVYGRSKQKRNKTNGRFA